MSSHKQKKKTIVHMNKDEKLKNKYISKNETKNKYIRKDEKLFIISQYIH